MDRLYYIGVKVSKVDRSYYTGGHGQIGGSIHGHKKSLHDEATPLTVSHMGGGWQTFSIVLGKSSYVLRHL